jgi:hypothetical protein
MFLNFLNFFTVFIVSDSAMGRPGRARKTPFKSKETKIVCRYCGLEGPKINRTSYKGMVKKLFFNIKSRILKRV